MKNLKEQPKVQVNDLSQAEGVELEQMRESNVKHFDFGGGVRQAILFPEPVHYQDAEGKWQDIDDRLIEEESAFVKLAGALRVKLPKRLNSLRRVELETDSHRLYLRYPNARSGEIKVTEFTHEDGLSPEERRLRGGNLYTEARYDDVAPGLSLVYTLDGDTFKDNYVLADKSALAYARALLDGEGLSFRMNEDNTIDAMADGEVAFGFAAPVTYDAAGTQIATACALTECPEGTVMSYVIDEAALDAAVFPVTIDPVVTLKCGPGGAQTLTLVQGGATLSGKYMRVGKSGSAEYAALIRFANLVELAPSDVVTNAVLKLTVKSSATTRYACVHAVNANWQPASVTWNNLIGAGSVSADALEYNTGASAGSTVNFNLTEQFRNWYKADANGASQNFGVVLRRPAIDAAVTNYQEFHSSTADNTSLRPVFAVTYISHAGTEGWWQYGSQSAGRAGDVSVNLFTGNVAVSHSDTAMPGAVNPVSVTHHYNSVLSRTPSSGELSLRCGHGWRHSALQYIREETVAGASGNDDYYVWTDGDGTDHWFKKSGTEPYKDKEGMGLKLRTYTKSGTVPFNIVIRDKQSNGMRFQKKRTTADTFEWGAYWLVNTWTRSFENTTKNEYAYDAEEGKLLSITDQAGRSTAFAYYSASDGVSSSLYGLLKSVSTPSQSVKFEYDGSKRLKYVYYQDLGLTSSKRTEYAYEGTTNLLTEAKNYDSLRVCVVYDPVNPCYAGYYAHSGDFMRQAASIETKHGYDSSLVYGAKRIFTYEPGQTVATVADTSDSNAGKKLIYQFNRSGNVTALRDEKGYAYFSDYADGDEDNVMTGTSKIQRVVINKLWNADVSANWEAVPNGGTLSYDNGTNSEKCLNMYSLKIVRETSATGESKYTQTVTLKPDTAYCFSAYVRKSDSNCDAFLRVTTGTGSGGAISKSVGTVEALTSKAANELSTDGWERISTTFTAPSEADVTAEMVLNGLGTVNFAAPQIEEGDIANSVNLLANGDFTSVTDGVPTGWTVGDDVPSGYGVVDSSGSENFPTALTGRVLKFSGDPRESKPDVGFKQEIAMNGKDGDLFFVGGWAKGNSVPLKNAADRRFGFRVRFKKTDGTWSEGATVNFNSACNDWQYVGGAVKAGVNYTRVRFVASYSQNCNNVEFTNLFLHREAYGKSFGYDANLNLTEMTALTGQMANMQYDSDNNVISYKQPGRSSTEKYTLTYGDSSELSQHLPRWIVTPMGVRTAYSYDGCGNRIAEAIRSSTASSSNRIRTSVEYDATNNYPVKMTDARGKETIQTVDASTGNITSVTVPAVDGETTTTTQTVNYLYDDSDHRLKQVKAQVGSGSASKLYLNQYKYTDDRLTTIAHNTVSSPADGADVTDVVYSIEHDGLGAQTKVSVGDGSTSQVLSQNIYDTTRAHKLTESRFGESDTYGSVRYDYDDFDRLTGVEYDKDTKPRYEYAYGANGRVARVKDKILNRASWTDYDLAGRPMQTHIVTPGSAGGQDTAIYATSLKYGKAGNLTRFAEEVVNTEFATNYTYDTDNRVTKIAFDDSTRAIEYEYDSLNRIAHRRIKIGTTEVYDSEYTFAAGNPNVTNGKTNMIDGITQGNISLYYSYDNAGNIFHEVRRGESAYYYYDRIGQLIRVDDERDTHGGSTGATWVYDYDFGGNIKSKIRYAYAHGVEPTALQETVAYNYATSGWKDKLVSVETTPAGGAATTKAVTVNEIGNTTNFDGWTYAWQAGRQLASAIKPGVAETTFAYDAGGMRTQKTVDGVTTEYTYHGSMLMHLKKGNNNLHFFYDAQSRPAFVSFNGTRYTYLHNLQGDIIGIVDDSGALVVEYGYDAWGAPTATTITASASTTSTLATALSTLNPFRYRGYIYDAETGLYYLKSRYYNPEWGRFINADSLGGETGKLLSHNVFTYCANNPVNAKDPSGHNGQIAAVMNNAPWIMGWDGDLPFADVLVAGLLVSAAMIDAGTKLYEHMTSTNAAQSSAVSIPKADVASATLTAERSAESGKYYFAHTTNAHTLSVYMIPAMTLDEAKTVVTVVSTWASVSGLNTSAKIGVYTLLKSDALALSKAVGGDTKIYNHGNAATYGTYYNHCHSVAERIHIWFGIGVDVSNL